MNATNPLSSSCVPGAFAGGLTRSSLLDGMILTHDDLAVEQRYWRLKRRLTNRALGTGVVWGLRLSYDEKTQTFTLSPGYALDCCGNDLIVQEAQTIRAVDLFDRNDARIAKLLTGGYSAKKLKTEKEVTNVVVGEKNGTPLAIILKYVECPEEPRALHLDACSVDATACQTSRVRETVVLDVALPPRPPVSKPIATFLKNLEASYQDKTNTDEVLEDVFPGRSGDPVAQEARTRYPFALHVRLGETERIVRLDGDTLVQANGQTGVRIPALQTVVTYPRSGSAPQPIVDLVFEIRPDPGWVLHRGQMSVSEGGPDAEVQAPFAVDLVWRYQIPLQRYIAAPSGTPGGSGTFGSSPDDGGGDFYLESAGQIGFSQLFGGGGASVMPLSVEPQSPADEYGAGRVHVTPLTHDGNDLASVNVSLDGMWLVGGEPENDGLFHERRGCGDKLGPGAIFLAGAGDDGAGSPKTLILAALYTWLKESLGGRDGTDPASFRGQEVLASWIYLTAWRMFFGVDPAAPDPDNGKRAYLAKLLSSLLQQWCGELMYPGPRCQDDHHGVVLGTATVGPNGSVRDFDAWLNRRYVLTGPLVSHWGQQFGLAPLDLVAGRFARWICCVADGGEHAAELGALPDVSVATRRLGGYESFQQPQPLGPGGALVSDGYYLSFGDDAQVGERFKEIGLKEHARKRVSWAELLKKLIECLMRSERPAPARDYVHYAVAGEPGASLHLFVSLSEPEKSELDRQRAQVRCAVREAQPVYGYSYGYATGTFNERAVAERVLSVAERPAIAVERPAIAVERPGLSIERPGVVLQPGGVIRYPIYRYRKLPALAHAPVEDFLVELLYGLAIVELPGEDGSTGVQRTLAANGVSSIGQLYGLGAERVAASFGPEDQQAQRSINSLFRFADKLTSAFYELMWQVVSEWEDSGQPPVTRASFHDPAFISQTHLAIEQMIDNAGVDLPVPLAVVTAAGDSI